MNDRVPIRTLPSGVPGLDEILGGGFPELSFNLIAGGPGCGKTTLGLQLLYANASPAKPGIFFSVIGEPPIKMLRYQQQFSFFDPEKINNAIRFVHLGDEALEGGLTKVCDRIIEEVDKANPTFIVVDSFRAVVRRTLAAGGESELQSVVQRLALHLTSCEATTFLLGEYDDDERDNSIFTVADGIVWLSQATERNSVVRKVQVVKMRGQGQIPGLHTARITSDGVSAFPRLLKPEEGNELLHSTGRICTGVAGLDQMLNGGIPQGYSVLLAGPSGSGKTVLSNQFIIEGVRNGEPGVIAIFEKQPNDYLLTTPRGLEFKRMVDEKKIELLYLRPLDLSIDETLLALREAVRRVGAKRAVIDSLSGLELALAPTFRTDFRESLYRLMGALTGLGITLMATVELEDTYTQLRFGPQGIAFLTDAIIMQRYIEIDANLKRALSVVKVRASAHSTELREYEIRGDGMLVVGRALSNYQGLLTGSPTRLLAPTP